MKKRVGLTQADMTWNPWEGCHKVSEGCRSCYMFSMKQAKGEDPGVVVRSEVQLKAPFSWPKPQKVFVCSMSDWFVPDADTWRDEAWKIVRETPQHIYMIVTKYVERIADHLPEGWPFENVYLGASIEDQKTADARLPHLLKVDAAARFINAEPLLGPVDLSPFMDWQAFMRWIDENWDGEFQCQPDGIPPISWVTVGQELGPGARYMDLEWVRPMIGQVRRVGATFFYKQDARL